MHLSYSLSFSLLIPLVLLYHVRVFKWCFPVMLLCHIMHSCIHRQSVQTQVLILKFFVRLSLTISGLWFYAPGLVHTVTAGLWCLFCILAFQYHSMLQCRPGDLQAFITLTSSFPYAKATDHSFAGNHIFFLQKQRGKKPSTIKHLACPLPSDIP